MTQSVECAKVFKGSTITNDENFIKLNNIKKVIVFDIDETIGSFYELMLLWNCFEELNIPMSQTIFNEMLDLFPEFLRVGILIVFEYLLHKKKTQMCHKVYIYTNNIYSPEFPLRIKNYFDYKLKTEHFFDKVICAFKINNQIVEPLRTTHKKTHDDFIKCTMLPESTNIFFIDDNYYEKMTHKKVYYIQAKPYRHGLSSLAIVERFINSTTFNEKLATLDINGEKCCREKLKEYVLNYFLFFGKKPIVDMKSKSEIDTDVHVTLKIMKHLKLFFHYKKGIVANLCSLIKPQEKYQLHHKTVRRKSGSSSSSSSSVNGSANDGECSGCSSPCKNKTFKNKK